jgi:hypothetical protein
VGCVQTAITCGTVITIVATARNRSVCSSAVRSGLQIAGPSQGCMGFLPGAWIAIIAPRRFGADLRSIKPGPAPPVR